MAIGGAVVLASFDDAETFFLAALGCRRGRAIETEGAKAERRGYGERDEKYGYAYLSPVSLHVVAGTRGHSRHHRRASAVPRWLPRPAGARPGTLTPVATVPMPVPPPRPVDDPLRSVVATASDGAGACRAGFWWHGQCAALPALPALRRRAAAARIALQKLVGWPRSMAVGRRDLRRWPRRSSLGL